jgi:hypothetical protein
MSHTKRTIAAVLTVLVMGVWLWVGGRRSAGPAGTGAPGPVVVPAPTAIETASPAEARVQALLESARRGDVAAYLDAFAGPLRARLEREADERGRDRFAADLRAAARSRKSHALFSAEPDGPASALVTVEAVYPDRNESQTYRVARDGEAGPWLVTEVETVRSRQPKAKYGSPAAFVAPEGNPVQGAGVVVETGDDQGPVPTGR